MEVRMLGDVVFVEFDDVAVADAEPRGVEIEVRFLFGGDADPEIGFFINQVRQILEFILVVQHGDDLFPSFLAHLGDVFHILRPFEAVADNIEVLFCDRAVFFQGFNQVQVIGGRGLQVDVVAEGLMQDKGELGTLGAVAVMVVALVVRFGHGHLEQALGALDLGGDLRQIRQLQRRAVTIDDFHQIDVVEHQIPVDDHEFILREVERLFDQVDVLVLHFSQA